MAVDMHRRCPVLTNNLSTLMGRRRVNVAEVARATGLAYKTVFELYHARAARLDLTTLDKLCNYFQVGPSDIFTWRPDGAAHEGDTGDGDGNGEA